MYYKGIEITRGEKVHYSASRLTDSSKNVDYTDILSNQKVYTNSPTVEGRKLYSDITKVFSVLNRHYQICNGGYSQYLCNGYHKANGPMADGDCGHLGRDGQLRFIKGELNDFAKIVLTPEEYTDYQRFVRVNLTSGRSWDGMHDLKNELGDAYNEAHKDSKWHSIGDWNSWYYTWDSSFEETVELYAQYLVKKYKLTETGE